MRTKWSDDCRKESGSGPLRLCWVGRGFSWHILYNRHCVSGVPDTKSERWGLCFDGAKTGSLVCNILVPLRTRQQIQKWLGAFICQIFLIIAFILNPKQLTQLDKSHLLCRHSHCFLSLLTITCWFLPLTPSPPTFSENNLFRIWDTKFGSCQVMTA